MGEPLDPHAPHGYEPVAGPPSYQPPGPESAGYEPTPYPPAPYPATGYPPAPYPAPQPAAQPGTPPAGWIGPDGTDGSWTPLPSAPPDRGRRTAVIAAAVTVVLVAAVVTSFLLLKPDHGRKNEAAKPPASFAGYTLLDNAASEQVTNSMRQVGHTMGGSAGRIFDAAAIGVYAHDTGDQPVLITFTVPTSVAGTGHSSDDITTEMLRGAIGSSDSFPAGAHGGSVRCGSTQFGTVSETMCAWSDPQRSGMLVSVRESLTPADLARVTQRFRDFVE